MFVDADAAGGWLEPMRGRSRTAAQPVNSPFLASVWLNQHRVSRASPCTQRNKREGIAQGICNLNCCESLHREYARNGHVTIGSARQNVILNRYFATSLQKSSGWSKNHILLFVCSFVIGLRAIQDISTHRTSNQSTHQGIDHSEFFAFRVLLLSAKMAL